MLKPKKLRYESADVKSGIYVDEKDIAILAELRKNSRESVKEIAENTDMHPNTVFQRIARLEKLKIIRGYNADIDFEKLGYGFHALVMMKSANKYVNVDNLWKEFGAAEIEAFYKITGDSDWAALIRTKSQKDFAEVIENILSEGSVKTISHIILNTEKGPPEYNPFLKPEIGKLYKPPQP